MKDSQRLYYSVNLPLRWIGLTLDEWAITLFGVICGILLINNDYPFLGLFFIFAGLFATYLLKKFKNISQYFSLKSWLLARGYIPAPSADYPHYLGRKIFK